MNRNHLRNNLSYKIRYINSSKNFNLKHLPILSIFYSRWYCT